MAHPNSRWWTLDKVGRFVWIGRSCRCFSVESKAAGRMVGGEADDEHLLVCGRRRARQGVVQTAQLHVGLVEDVVHGQTLVPLRNAEERVRSHALRDDEVASLVGLDLVVRHVVLLAVDAQHKGDVVLAGPLEVLGDLLKKIIEIVRTS